MKIIIHRGTHEIGGNCVEVVSGESRLILDLGMPLFDSCRQPVDSFALGRKTTPELHDLGILPAVPGLYDAGSDTSERSPDAILLSHAHLDHTGLLNHSSARVPIYASCGTSKMMLAGSLFAGQAGLSRERFREIKAESPINIGPFTVTAYNVDHSIYAGLAFLIEAGGKRLFYSGDLRLHGRKPGMHRRIIEVLGGMQVDTMLMEGTHVRSLENSGARFDEPTISEYGLEASITKRVQGSPGLVLVSFSPQHLDRFVTFIRAAIRSRRTLVVDLYAAFILHLLRYELPLPVPEDCKHLRVYVPNNLQRKVRRQPYAAMMARYRNASIQIGEIVSNPEQFVMIFRPSMLSDDFGGIFPSRTSCVYSRWDGYLKHDDWQCVQEKIGHVGGEFFSEHVSGHMLPDDIRTFVQAISPKVVIPMHTFEPELFTGLFTNAVVLGDGVPYIVR